MPTPRYRLLSVVVILFTLLTLHSVMADDGRINRAPYHFGGDTLFCNSTTGCTLLDKTGHFLWNWPQADIVTAFDTMVSTGINTLVGEGTGTYGSAELWAMSWTETNGDRILCFNGFDEWGKANSMCFHVTTNYIYEPAPLPVYVPTVPRYVPDCSMWKIGDFVFYIPDSSIFGEIVSIDTANGTVTLDDESTVPCDQIFGSSR